MGDNQAKRVFETYHPESVVGTEFRRLLHNITRPVDGISRKSFLITSAMLAEGKSTVAAYLALTAASHKKRRTVLIDADLRRPAIHRMFGLEPEKGFSDLITGDLKIEDALKQTPVPDLSILTAGSPKQNPAQLFDSDATSAIIEQAKFYFDFVFVDTAPVIPVSDPISLAPELDGVLLVVKAGATQMAVIKRAYDIVSRSDATIVGVVLNNVNGVLPYYYNYTYYGYSYAVHRR